MTKPIQVVTRWERFKRHTVWHARHTNPNDEYRHGPRFWYPGYDIIAMVLGIYAVYLGSPLLNRLFPEWFTNGMGVTLIIASTMALVGVVFPRLFPVELAGKLVIVFMMGGYAGTVAMMSGQSENGFVVICLIMTVWLLGPRVTWLFIRTSRALARRRHAKGAP
jgi:hypothetical protein